MTTVECVTTTADSTLVRRTLEVACPFKNWPPEARQRLTLGARVRCYPVDSLIMRRGQVANALYIVIKGSVEISAENAEGRRYVIRYAGPSRAFGLLSVMDGKACPHYYRAHEETIVAIISCDLLFAVANADTDLLMSLFRELTERYRFSLRQMEEQAFDPLRTRLIRALLVLVETYGIPQDSGTVIQLRLAQDHLGDLLGVSRQSINKVIKQLEAEQLIEMHYGRVIVRDLDALRAIAHAEGIGAIVD